MEAIGLNPIRLDAIGIDPIRLNAIRLGVLGASSGSDRPYIAPEVLASLVAVVKCDGKSNNDPDRAIIKNLVDPDNPFVISNAAYKLNSGFGKYEEDFSTWKAKSNSGIKISSDGTKIETLANNFSCQYEYSSIGRDVPSFKVKISNFTEGTINYYYREEDGNEKHINFGPITVANSKGIIELPKSYNTVENGIGFRGGFVGILGVNIGVTIEQIPSFQGALVTDGVDDVIRSQKTIGEMLDGSNEITVVSMIHLIDINHAGGSGFTNYVRVGSSFIRNDSKVNDKTGIYGWTYSNSGNIGTINNILGDKNDYKTIGSSLPLDSVFNVEGYSHSSGIAEICQVAWYWTFIANRVLTSDEINQVIAYYNLDKHVKPDVYYDVKKQGLSNNTPDADWYLKDFSGNGRDMQLYNFAKKLGSGVGKYEADYSTWVKVAGVSSTPFGFKITGEISSNYWLVYAYNSITPAHKVKVSGIPEGGELRYASESIKLENGINELPEMEATSARGFTIRQYTTQLSDWIGLSVEQIPDYEGALVFDAVEDYGQFVGDLGLKDYTVAVDRAYPSLKGNGVPVISSIKGDTATPFLFEFADNTSVVRPYSFGATTVLSPMELSRKISYQSTYIYDGTAINKGLHGNTGNGLTIGRFGIDTQYANIALWSLLLFPYTLSEFLLERQLKRYKLGSIYPSNSIVFRPYITSNLPYNVIEIRINNELVYYWINQKINNDESGKYFPKGSTMNIRVKHDNTLKIPSKIKYNGKEDETSYYANGVYQVDVTLDKTPQKIEIQIDEYIHYEDIVQPYPFIIPIIDTDGKEYTYGDKIKVGTEIRGGINGNNLLPELYKLNGYFNFNGAYFSASNKHVIGKTNVFELTNAPTYLKANEPNCIADPQRLRIPNSSYKILGYIPDISGHGNHLKINNSAYAGMSGANGYSEDFTTWLKSSGVKVDNDKIEINASTEMWLLRQYTTSASKFKVNVVGIPNNGTLKYGTISNPQQLHNGINELDAFSFDALTDIGFFKTGASANDWIGLIIEQIGEYEGSFCLDGVEDYLTIPTLEGHGGKQVLMKVNYRLNSSRTCTLYDQRTILSGWQETFTIVSTSYNIAYALANNGQTYIDGILNTNIIGNSLANITHNITVVNENVSESNTGVINIGAQAEYKGFGNLSLFAFMSFDDISSEEEIKELNDIVGIEGGYVESPDYYWDAYGKSNKPHEDIDYGILGESVITRNRIFDKSVEGLKVIETGNVSDIINRALTANNFAYSEESGHGGQSLILPFSIPYSGGWDYANDRASFEPLDNGNSVKITQVKSRVALFWSGNPIKKAWYKVSGVAPGKGIKFGSDVFNVYSVIAESDGIYEVDWSLNTNESGTKIAICIMSNGWIGECDITIEQVAQYQNGLLFNGSNNYLTNSDIPSVTDFTVLIKCLLPDDFGNSDGCVIRKGSHNDIRNGGYSFIYALDSVAAPTSRNSYWSFGNQLKSPPAVKLPLIGFMTPTNVNGVPITKNGNPDANGMCVGAWLNYLRMVYFKVMFYPKTIDMLSINMLKNLFAQDILIDVNNPIFKQNN
ncbi:hypothetical protein F070042J6_09780 [Bacteroides sp. f07]|uniref:hypothetical protein n=1 Tax=Bacteroides sp. f07 TaxID=3132704 RepID=UPI0034B48D64